MALLTKTCNSERMNLERLFARGFVAFGGLFWAAATFSANFGYRDTGLFAAAGPTLLPLGITVAVFVLGMYYEYLAAAVLGAGAVAAVVWGLVVGWETGVWLTTSIFLIAPMVIGALLYLLAARMQDVCAVERGPRGVGTPA